MLDQSCKWLSSAMRCCPLKYYFCHWLPFGKKKKTKLKNGTPCLSVRSFPRSESRGKGPPLRSQIHGAWGLLPFHCFVHSAALFQHRYSDISLPQVKSCRIGPPWDLKGHRDPCVSPLIMTLTHNEDDFLCRLATQRLILTSWEKGSCFLASSHRAPGAERPWLLAIRGIPKQHQSKKGLVKRQNVSLKNKSKHCLVGGLSYCCSWFKLGFWWRRKCSNFPHNQWGLADTPDSSLPQF